MAKQDFAVGLLQGLYNGGVGNPQVNSQMRQNALQEAFTKQKMDIQAQENGMTPDVHPETHNIVKSFLFPGLGDSFQGYKPDPNASVYSQDATGKASLGTRSSMTPGSVMLDKEKGASLLASQEQKAPDTMLVYDKNNQRPRIESLDYIPKPGEMAQKTTLGDALTKTGAFASNEARGGFFDARAGQIGLGAADEIKKGLDPSNLSRGTTLGAAASSVKRAINGLTLLNQPTVTKTALEATMGDIDSILTQAGATVEGRRMLNTPNFMNNIANFKSFVSTAPENVAVPSGVVNIYKNILNDLGPIAQNSVKDYVERTSKIQKPKALRFVTPEQYDSYKQDILDSYDIQKQLQLNSGNGGNSSAAPVNTPLTGNKPKTVTQGGQTYTLNPLTGKYE